MPGMDGTGPWGTGAIGRGRGSCGTARKIGTNGQRARGFGRCFRSIDRISDPKTEREVLERDIATLEDRLKVLKERLGRTGEGSE